MLCPFVKERCQYIGDLVVVKRLSDIQEKLTSEEAVYDSLGLSYSGRFACT